MPHSIPQEFVGFAGIQYYVWNSVWNKNELDKLIFVVYKMANTELSNEWLINVFSGKLEDILKFEMVKIKMNTLYLSIRPYY